MTLDDINEDPRRLLLGKKRPDRERIDDFTELVTVDDPDRDVWQYREQWTCGLDNAPPVGGRFLIVHEEWIREYDGLFRRIIHDFEFAEASS